MDGSRQVPSNRRRHIGAEAGPDRLDVRVWAPGHERVTLVTPQGRDVPLSPEAGGYFRASVEGLGAGSLYGFRLGDEGRVHPDPASRYQPEGPDGWSQALDPGAFPWTDANWPGLLLKGQVIMEIHVGTFTEAGTWVAAMDELPRLRDLGITAVEVMPVAEWPGHFGWGYDGTLPFAPFHRYGAPDDMRAFVDHAHALGIGVILDVVYNHLGPEGNHIPAFAPCFLSKTHSTDWGQQPNFDGEASADVRAYVLANVAQWIDEYHVDGLRLDATQDITDMSEEHILAAITRTARAAAGPRKILIIAENEPQNARILQPPEAGGYGMDAVWADDIHHSAFVALTGRRSGYLRDYSGSPQELLSAIRRGWLFQGQRYAWHGRARGTPGLDVAPSRFVAYLENHDQVANTGDGRRLHQRTSPGRMRAMTALLLLGPATPMLFQGQEAASETRFAYFLDVREELHASVRDERIASMGQFAHLAAPEMMGRIPDPTLEATFLACKLHHLVDPRGQQAMALHRDLIHLRREDPTIRLQGEAGLTGAVIGPEAFALRLFGEEGRTLIPGHAVLLGAA
jgi:maltooligosyltrehalose trehalohydrolase